MLPRRRRYRYRHRRLAPLWLVVAAAFVVGAWTGVAHKTPPAAHASAPPAALARVAETLPSPKPAAPPPKPIVLIHGAPLLAGKLHVPIAAAAAILVDADTGQVLWARHPHQRREIASTTKIMTALLALRNVGWHQLITVAPQVTRVPLVREGLRAGEQVQAWKLFYAMLLYSGNDDALQLALAAAGTQPAFVREMNAEAAHLSMHDTHYASTSGVVDKDNYSSAWDVAAVTREALQNPVFRKIVRTPRIEVPWSAPTYSKIYVNNNLMLRLYPGATGVKTGYTHLSGWCLVTSATRRGHTLISVVLDSGDMYNDSKKLLDLGFASLR
ncbi:MAG: D-alanyl-D-alanine carboxypeptidase [Actinobacteria bacterium]|nr:D-alanyl-D-alanine carboxypeptidase [Actinomycetota bacterium]